MNRRIFITSILALPALAVPGIAALASVRTAFVAVPIDVNPEDWIDHWDRPDDEKYSWPWAG